MFESVEFSVKDIPFGRYGSYLTLMDEGTPENGSLILASTHAMLANAQTAAGKSRSILMHFSLCSQGVPVPYRAIGTPSKVILKCDAGKAELTIDSHECVRIRAEGVELCAEALTNMHEIAKSRNDGSWEICFLPAWKLLIQPLEGRMEANAEINWLETKTENVRFVFPLNNGKTEAAIHLYESNMLTPSRYSAFDEVVTENESSFAAFLETVPLLSSNYEKARILTSYGIWSNIMLPGNMVKVRTMFCSKKMFPLGMAWHQSYAAIVLYRNPELAWDLITSMFYHQDLFGMIPDWIKDSERTYTATKPPIQGYAILYLLEHADLSGIRTEQFVWLYEHLDKLHNWWLSFRDTDTDGIPQYDSGDESGWDDATIFSKGVPVESPDLSTYLIFIELSLSKLASLIGLVRKSAEWQEKADRLLKEMIAFFWDGTKFTARKNATHERVECFSTVSYQPLLLGKRLPAEIIDAMVRDLSKEGDYLTEFGFASERLDSPLFRPTSWLAGSINTAMNFQLITGLYSAGETALARKAAERFMKNAVRENWPFSYDSHTGKRLNRPSSLQPLTSWMCVLFLGIANLFSGEAADVKGESV